MLISANVNLDSFIATMTTIERSVVPQATARALNRTAAEARTQVVRKLASQTGLKQKSIREKLIVVRARRSSLVAELQVSGRPLNLLRFGARQTKRGVSAKAWGKRRVYPGTFLGNRGRTVFKRVGGKRLPIKPVWGPSIPREFIRNQLDRTIGRVVRERFPVHFRQNMAFLLSKQR